MARKEGGCHYAHFITAVFKPASDGDLMLAPYLEQRGKEVVFSYAGYPLILAVLPKLAIRASWGWQEEGCSHHAKPSKCQAAQEVNLDCWDHLPACCYLPLSYKVKHVCLKQDCLLINNPF